MSNSPAARPLFRDIQGDTLAELLTAVRRDTSPLGSTDVPALDVHLNESDLAAACKPGDVIELHGPAASGKTHLLYYMLINCLLPSSHSSVKLGGWGKAAVFFDTYHKFNVQRFAQLLSSRVKRLLPLDPSAVEAITTKSLGLLHIFRPTNSHQLAATVHHLPMYLATNLPEADLGILAIDSISNFYWSDRYLLEQTRSGNLTHPLTRFQNPLSYVLASIRSFNQSYGPLVLLSTWDLGLSSMSQNGQYPDTSTSVLHSDATGQGQQIIPISQHITLGKTTTYFGGEENKSSERTCISGTVHTPGTSKVSQFSFHITEDDILVP